jgi:arsenate reductase
MLSKTTRVLFVSKNNAARSLLAEACLRQLGAQSFHVFSCGVPGCLADKADSTTLATLATAGFKTVGLHPKDWTEFSRHGSKPMDIVIAMDAETKGDHPSWPGQPETALWDYGPLDKLKGESHSDRDIRTIQPLHSLRRRIELLVSLRQKVGSHADLRHDIRDMAHL